MRSITTYDFGKTVTNSMFSNITIKMCNDIKVFEGIKTFLAPDRIVFFSNKSNNYYTINIVTNIIAINSRRFYITTIDFNTFENALIEVLLNL